MVPSEHAVDSFRELGRRSLVDAAGIDPYPVIFVGKGFVACGGDFGPAFCLALFAVEEVTVGKFLFLAEPPVGQYCIVRAVVVEKFIKHKIFGVEEAHGDGVGDVSSGFKNQ